MNDQTVNNGQQQSPAPAEQVRPVSVASRYRKAPILCVQCTDPLYSEEFSFHFVDTFREAFNEASHRGKHVTASLREAKDATMNEFADVWTDSAKLEIAVSFLLRIGTQYLLKGYYYHARWSATIARFLEQYNAVELKQSQALYHFPKIDETACADMHTLVKFFRTRIPCSCLDRIYQEVKSVAKVGICYNMQCKIPTGHVERSRTKYCSRCRSVTYCSLECQKADWTRHTSYCDTNSAIKVDFEVNQHNMSSI